MFRSETDKYSKFDEKVGFIWVMAWENLFMPYMNNKGAGQSANQMRSLISAFVVPCLNSILPKLATSKISRL